MNPQISFKSQSFNAGNYSLNYIVRSSDFRNIVLYRASSFSKNSKNSLDTFFCCTLNLSVVHRLHHPWIGSQESRVKGSTNCWNNLTWRTLQRSFAYFCFNNSKLNISHRLITKRTLSCTPSEPLNCALPNSIQSILIGSSTNQRIIN